MPICDSLSEAGLTIALAFARFHVMEVARSGSITVSLVGSCPYVWLRDDRPRATAA